ncbi:unnamed protein product [Arctogadus glacialis]
MTEHVLLKYLNYQRARGWKEAGGGGGGLVSSYSKVYLFIYSLPLLCFNFINTVSSRLVQRTSALTPWKGMQKLINKTKKDTQQTKPNTQQFNRTGKTGSWKQFEEKHRI